MFLKEEKELLIKEYQLSDNDSGSVEVQCAILSKRISVLAEHLKSHRKDFSSKRSLYVLINNRKRLLSYLSEVSMDRYTNLLKRLGLKNKKNNR